MNNVSVVVGFLKIGDFFNSKTRCAILCVLNFFTTLAIVGLAPAFWQSLVTFLG
jgi:hypothetical protein